MSGWLLISFLYEFFKKWEVLLFAAVMLKVMLLFTIWDWSFDCLIITISDKVLLGHFAMRTSQAILLRSISFVSQGVLFVAFISHLLIWRSKGHSKVFIIVIPCQSLAREHLILIMMMLEVLRLCIWVCGLLLEYRVTHYLGRCLTSDW